MTLRQTVIRNIKIRRTILGMSQSDLAKKSKLSLSTLGQLEIDLKAPTIETIMKIAKALKLKSYELLKPDLYES